jgi:signal transduction histidine kinase
VPLTDFKGTSKLRCLSNPDLSPLPLQTAGGQPTVPQGARRAPARWLIGVLIALMLIAAGLANIWGLRQRSAGVVSLTTGQPEFRMDTLADPGASFSFADVLGREAAFAASPARKPFAPCVWYRLTIANDSDTPRHSIVALNNDFILDARLYQSRGAHPPLVERSGASVRWYDRAVPAAKVAFEVELPPHVESVFYVRVHDSVKQPTAFFLWNDVETFRHLTEVYRLEYACYFALWFGLFIYNAFLYAVLRRRDYLLYLCYMLSVGAFLVTASEVSTLVVGWPLWPLRGILGFILLNLTTVSLARFSRVFLETQLHLPRTDRWLKGLVLVVLLSSLGSPLWFSPGWAPIYETVVALLNMVLLAVLPVCGLVLYFRRKPQAGIYVLAFLPIVGALVYLLESSLGMPDGRNNSMPPLTASAVELVFLALALAWRYRLITDEADRLKAEYTARLEREVASHTRELRATNDSLSQANRDKDRVFSILGHDLRGPANMLSGLSQLMTKAPEMMSPAEVSDLAAEIDEACHSQLELLDNLLLWGRTQSGNLTFAPTQTAVADIAQAAANALGQAARRKGIQLAVAVESGLVVWSDPKAAETIVRNLIGNAVKFTPAGGSVTVRAVKKGSQVEIIVSDNGVGIEPPRLDQLLSGPVVSKDGTGAEKGIGLGLTLCRDLARSNGGDLKISSELRKGTTAVLILPCAVS